jgi:hypothetical protein
MDGWDLPADGDTVTIEARVLVGSVDKDGVVTTHNNNVITNNGYIAGFGFGPGVVFDNAGLGTLFNNAGASILGGDGVGIFHGGKTVVNHGVIYGLSFTGVELDFSVSSFSLTNDGTIYGHLSGLFAGGSATITNTGTGFIHSDKFGVDVNLLGTSPTITITNDVHATIGGSISAINTRGFGNADLTLDNFGTLLGGVQCALVGANTFILNKGVIDGNVMFQSGGGTFVDAGRGHVTGVIEGGTDTDMFVAGRARELFSAGTGADTFIFNSASFSPVGPKHDIIFNFSHVAGDKIDMHHILAAGHHLVFIGTHTFAHYHTLHPGVVGMVRFTPGAHQLQATVDGDFSAPDLMVSLPGVAALHAGDLILV